MPEFKETVGIDVSKDTLDVFIHSTKQWKQFKNNEKQFDKIVFWVLSKSASPRDQIIFSFEYTGVYSIAIRYFFDRREINYLVSSGLEIKRSLGLKRGKNDKVDSQQLALYAYRRRDEIVPSRLPNEAIIKMKSLLSLRRLITKHNVGLELSKQSRDILAQDLKYPLMDSLIASLITSHEKTIKRIDKLLDRLVKEDIILHNIFNLLTSINCVGTLTACYMIAYTQGFMAFPNAKKFSCYCGIAPFPYSSGISLHGKDKVCPFGHKRLKAILSICATIAKIHNPTIKKYYQKKIAEGKHQMLVNNNIKNKLVAIMFAVVRSGRPYVEKYSRAEVEADLPVSDYSAGMTVVS